MGFLKNLWRARFHGTLDALTVSARQLRARRPPEPCTESPAERRYKQESEGAAKPKARLRLLTLRW